MATLVKNGRNYGLIWTDKSRTPKQTRESLKTDELRIARRRKARLEYEYWEGDHDPWKKKWYQKSESGRSVSVGDAIEEFIRFKSTTRGRKGWNQKTAEKEAYVLRKFARILGKKRGVDQITEADLQQIYYRPGVTSDHTRNSDYISVNTFLNWCLRKGYIKNKPEFRPKAPQTKLPKFIPIEAFAKLIWAYCRQLEQDIKTGRLTDPSKGSYWIPLGWMTLAGTGMRPVELSHLKVRDIESGWAMIGEDFTTKTRAERRVPLLYEAYHAVQILADPKFRNKEYYMNKSDLLLGRKPDHAKRKLSEAFTDSWKELYPDRPKKTLYNLKDTFCVRFLSDQGQAARLNELREILGHSSLNTTQRYLKAVPYGTRLTGTIWDHMPVE